MVSNNQLGMVRAQFQTRGYTVDDVQMDHHNHSKFTIESDRERQPVAITVTFIPTPANPHGEYWIPENIHWGTDKTTYTGTDEGSAAALADRILDTIAEDSST